MKAYKGFNKDMTCRGFQFKEGETYQEDNAVLCESGFHACENPLDCFRYYAPNNSVYHEVELGEVTDEHSEDDSKRCGNIIKIGARLDIAGIVKAHFEYVKSNCDKENASSATGDCGASSATGNCGASSATGDYGASSATGLNCIALSTGYAGKAKASIGSAICVCERGEWNGETYPLLSIKAAIVDGEKIKADTWYRLENGEFVEVVEDE